MTKLIRGLHSFSHLTSHWTGCIATIGNFDGLHKGHQKMLHQLLAAKQALPYPTVVIVFEPQPKEYFQLSPPARLMRLTEKYQALKLYGVDFVLCLYFNRDLAEISAESFVETILQKTLKIKHLVVGANFRFGFQRSGNVALLERYARQSDFSVDVVSMVCHQGQRVSSTRLRQLLGCGDLETVKALLGRAYTRIGKVVRGDQRGRSLGYPTANLRLQPPFLLRGVYVVTVDDLTSGRSWKGVANVGKRPTVDGKHYWLEVHIFDFNEIIYGHRLKVAFHRQLRDEKAFDSLDALVAQIKQDVERAKAYFLSESC